MFLKYPLFFNHIGRHKLFQWEDIHKRQPLAKYQRDLILNKLTRAKFCVTFSRVHQYHAPGQDNVYFSMENLLHDFIAPFYDCFTDSSLSLHWSQNNTIMIGKKALIPVHYADFFLLCILQMAFFFIAWWPCHWMWSLADYNLELWCVTKHEILVHCKWLLLEPM